MPDRDDRVCVVCYTGFVSYTDLRIVYTIKYSRDEELNACKSMDCYMNNFLLFILFPRYLNLLICLIEKFHLISNFVQYSLLVIVTDLSVTIDLLST